MPAGFGNVSASTSATGWAAAVSGNVVTLTSTAGNEIAHGSSVVADITADAPTSTGSPTWLTAADKSNGFTGTGPFSNTGSDPSVVVQPGPLDHFDISSSATPQTAIPSQSAGTPFTVYVTAYDAHGNVKTDYPETNDSPELTGLADSPAPASQPASYPTLTFTNGVASGDVTAFFANDPTNLSDVSNLTVKDTGTGEGQGVSSDSNTFDVAPAVLDHFTWTGEPGGNQTAGTTFGQTITATAYDAYDNVATNYDPTPAAIGGLSPSPSGCASDNQTVTPGGTYGCDPIYGFGWDHGVATSSTVKDYKAETTQLTVTDATTNTNKIVSADSDQVVVAPAALDHFDFGHIDGQTAGAHFGVSVTARDAYGNQQPYGGSGNIGGLAAAPDGTPPVQPTVNFSGGTASGDVTAYFANDPNASGDNSQLTITGGGKNGTSNTFKVAPAGLDHFTFATIAGQTAGAPFTVNVTARDQFANTEYDYTGSGAIGGLQNSPAPVNQPPVQPTLSFGAGVASGNVEAFLANDPLNQLDNSQLTITGGGKNGTSNTFKVAPAGLDHFTFATIGPQIAGNQFGITVTARDQYANTEYDYSGSGTVTGLQNSPAPVNQSPVQPTLSFGAGVASGNVKAFFANDPNNGSDNSQLTVNGSGHAGVSNTFKVAPAGLDHFTFANVGPQIAGKAFGITVTGRDQYANREYDFNGNGTLSGLNNSPAPASHAPGYPNPLGFTNGVGSGNVTAYFANNPNNANDLSQLSIAGGNKSGSSNTFKVQAADPATLTFTTQPNDTQPNPPSCSGNAVCVIQTVVKDLDPYSNPEVGVAVNVQIDPANNPGSDSLTGLTTGECTGGVCTQNADNNGVATFSDLTLHNVATNYKLKATSGPTVGNSPPATQISALFNVAQTVTKCNGNCTANATDTFDNITATATGLSGDLSITLENKSLVGTCGITNQVGNFDTINPTNPSSNAPTLEISGTLLHKSNKGGVGNFIFCKNSGPNTPFHTVALCSQTRPKNTAPCLVKLSGNGQGDLFFDLIVKATKNADGTWTFDPIIGGGT